MKSLPHLFDYTLKNRAFNCRMRNRYYEEVYYAFRSLEQRLKNYENEETDNHERFYTIDQEIRRYEQILEKCLEYAQASVFFGKTNANKEEKSFHKALDILQLRKILITTYAIVITNKGKSISPIGYSCPPAGLPFVSPAPGRSPLEPSLVPSV